jgi:DNA-binding response OmpR family regulator
MILLEAKNIENLKNNFNPKLLMFLRSIGINSTTMNVTAELINYLIDSAVQKNLSKADQDAIQKFIMNRLHTKVIEPEEIDKKDEFEVNEKTYTVKLPQNKELKLPKIEFELLKYFWNHPNSIHSKEQLLDQVWNEKGDNVFDTTVTVQISKLNAKLPNNRKILSKKGVGYYIVKK